MLKYQPKTDTETEVETAIADNKTDSFSKYDSIENMILEMKTPREDVNADKKPAAKTEEETEVIEDAPELKEPENISTTPGPPVIELGKNKISDKKARLEAKFLARTNDNVNSLACSFIADEDPDDFGADEDEIEDITEYFYNWRSESTEPLPIWMELVIGIGFIYAPKYKQAFKLRKVKKLNLILENEKTEMQQTIQHQLEKIKQLEQKESITSTSTQ